MKLRQARKTETTICYAVLIQRKDGTEFFSCGPGASRALFYKRAEALQHAADVAEQCRWPRRKCRVVKVESVVQEVRKAGR